MAVHNDTSRQIAINSINANTIWRARAQYWFIALTCCWLLTPNIVAQQPNQTEGSKEKNLLVPGLLSQMVKFRDDAPEESIKLGNQALKILAEKPNPRNELQIQIELSWAESRSGNATQGLLHAQKALDLAKQTRNPTAKAIAKYHIALAHWYDGEADKAIEACDNSCTLHRKHNNSLELAKSLTLMGAIHRSRSAYHDSLVAHQEALGISRSVNDQDGISRANNNIGLVHWRLGNHQKALKYIEAVIPYYRARDSKPRLAQALSNLGLINIELKQPDQALIFLNQALDLHGEDVQSRSLARVLANIAYAHEELGDLGQALEHYRRAFEIRKGMNDRWGCSRSLGQIGNIQALNGQHREAIDSYHEGIRFALKSEAKDEQSQLYNMLARSFKAIGNYEKALAAFEKHVDVEAELKRAETARKIAEIESDSKIAKQQSRLEALERSRVEQSLAFAQQRESQWLLIAIFSMVLAIGGVVLIVGQARAIRAKKRSYEKLNQALENLKESENRYRCVFENSIVPNLLIDFEHNTVLELNTAAQNQFHLDADKLRHQSIDALKPVWLSKILTSININESHQQHRLHNEDNRERFFATCTFAVTLHGQSCAIVTLQDVTEQRRREEDRIRLEKLESLGLMAGGIAHDFKNALTAVLGYVGLARNRSQNDSELTHFLERAELAGEQAEWLTSQLVTFAKSESPQRKQHDLSKLLVESVGLVSSGSKMEVEYELAPSLSELIVDKGQFKQVISNIAINAHQAMESGGKLIVSAENFHASTPLGPTAPPGDYVRIEIQDSGPGIPDDVRSKILDPYFTTKDTGTGLGLSTAFAIVQQHNGHMEFHSVEGEGTTFAIFFPLDAPQSFSLAKAGEDAN